MRKRRGFFVSVYALECTWRGTVIPGGQVWTDLFQPLHGTDLRTHWRITPPLMTFFALFIPCDTEAQDPDTPPIFTRRDNWETLNVRAAWHSQHNVHVLISQLGFFFSFFLKIYCVSETQSFEGFSVYTRTTGELLGQCHFLTRRQRQGAKHGFVAPHDYQTWSYEL